MTTQRHVRGIAATGYTGDGTKALHDDGAWKVPTGDGGGGGAAVTAWTPLPLASGIVSHADNFGFPPQYRKVGDEVQIRGVVRRSSGSFGTGNTLIATLPVGFRPADPGGGAVTPVIYASSASSGAISTRIQFNLDGTVYVATAGSSAWASISVPGFSTL